MDASADSPSMFDSAGASGLTVEVPETEQGARILQDHLASSPEVSSMLVVDPAGAWAQEMMDALAEATGSPVDRLRMHAGTGPQVRAVVDEMLLPAGTGPHRLVRCLHDSARGPVPGVDRLELFGTLLAHSQVCAVLVGGLSSAQAHALVDDVRRLSQRPDAAGVRWLFYLGADQRGMESRIVGAMWPARASVLHARPLHRSVSSVWNSLYAAWIGG